MVITKNYVYCNIWDWDTFDFIENILSTTPNITFIYDCRQEYEPIDLIPVEPVVKLTNTVNTNNIKFYLILGSLDINESKYPEVFLKSAHIVYNPTYWVTQTFNSLYSKASGNRVVNFDLLFTCFVNQPKHHRCVFIDELYGSSAVNLGFHTWNNLTKKYVFQNWEQTVVNSNDSYKQDKNNSNWTIPDPKYFKSLFDIVLETTDECTFYTEKTFRPIFFKKLFIIYGSPNINYNLKKLGFLLFDDIVDYSFDSIKDNKIRASKLCDELKRINTFSGSYDELYKKVAHIVEHNFNHAEELARSGVTINLDSADKKLLVDFKLDSYIYSLLQSTKSLNRLLDN